MTDTSQDDPRGPINNGDLFVLSMLMLQSTHLDNIARLSYTDPKEALRQLTEELPTTDLLPNLRWLWHAVFYQTAGHIKDNARQERRAERKAGREAAALFQKLRQ